MLAVVGEQARVQFRVAGAAGGAGTGGGKHLQPPQPGRRAALCHGGGQSIHLGQQVHRALADLQGLGQLGAQPRFVGRIDHPIGHRQLDGVFLETVDARESGGGQKLAIHPQMRVAARARPVSQFGIHAFAVDHQRCQQTDVLSGVTPQDGRRDAVRALRHHRRTVVHAMLYAQLHIQQAQEMPDLGGRADGRLAAATAQALFDGHRGGNAVDRVHLGAPRGLHDAAGVGVEALQVAPLAFVEQDVERQGGLARSADAGNHVELAARNVHTQALEVVFAGVDDADAAFPLVDGHMQVARPAQVRQRGGLAG